MIPAYNEEARLPGTLELIGEYLEEKNLPAEVLVVNDGSQDGTVVAAERAARLWPVVRVLQNPGNRGKGYSVRNGMLHATGEFVLFTDADLSAPIGETDVLLDTMRQGYDVVIGSRALRRELIGVHQSWFRETAGKLFNVAVRLLTGLPFKDTQCGFKMFRLAAAREVFGRQQLERFGFDAEALYLAQKLGYRIAEVPVRWNHVEGTKVSMMRDSVDMFLDLLRIRWMDLQGKYREARQQEELVH